MLLNKGLQSLMEGGEKMLNLGRAVAALMQAETEKINGFDEMEEIDQVKKSLEVAILLAGNVSSRFVKQLMADGFNRQEAMSILIATISREP